MDTPVVQPPPPPDAPPVPLPQKPRNYSGLFIGILLLVLGILVGMELSETTFISNLRAKYLPTTPTPAGQNPLGGASPTPDPTANWKMYTNTKYGYSLKFPLNYELSASMGVDGDSIPQSEWNNIYISEGNRSVDNKFYLEKPHVRIIALPITAFNNQSLFSTATYQYQENLKLASMPAQSVMPPQQIVFKGNKAYTFELKNKGLQIFYTDSPSSNTEGYVGYNGLYKIYWVDHNNVRYLIYLTVENLTDQILSTFRFTNQNQSCNTDTDCPTGKTCQAYGPVVVNGPQKKMCIGSGEAVPF